MSTSLFKINLVCLITIFFTVFHSYAEEDIEIETNIHILMDLSTSYYGKGTITENKRALQETFKVIRKIAKDDIERPAIIQVLGITEISTNQKIICEAQLTKGKIFKSKKNDQESGAFKKPKQLYNYLMEQCLPAILDQKPRNGTDISGALDKSTRIARSQAPYGDNVLIVHSDFFEYRAIVNGKKLKMPDIDLEGFHILLVYRAEFFSKYDGKFINVDEAVNSWRKSMKDMGAEKIVIVSDEAKFASFAADELF